MPAWVVSEAARLAVASDVMLVAAATTALTAHALGTVVHQRALEPGLRWKQVLVAAAHHESARRALPPEWPVPRREARTGRAAADPALRATTIAAGVMWGLLGLVLVVVSGHITYPGRIVGAAVAASIVAGLMIVVTSRSAAARTVLSRRGMHLLASSVFREASGVGAMVTPVLVVAHTAGLTGTSVLEVGAVALATRLVIAAVPVAGGLGAADATMVAGLTWMGIPAPVGIAAAIIWRTGSLGAVLAASIVARRTEPATFVWDIPARDGVGRRLHRAAFGIVGLLPQSGRERARRWVFDTMFSMSPDPWGYREVPYERRKRQHLLDAVGPHARVIVEVGCADGHNLLALAQALPAATIVGTDVSTAAVRIAADSTMALPNVRVANASDLGALAEALPGPVDCIVLAEVLYYLGGQQAMNEALAPLRSLMAPHARVVMVHGCTDARTLHSRAAAALGMTVVEASEVADHERPFEIAVAATRT